MSVLVAATIKSSVLIAAGLLGATLCRRRSASFRHWVLAASLACAGLVPLAEPLAPSWHVAWAATTRPRALAPSELIATRADLSASDVAAPAASATPRLASTKLALVWGGGAGIAGLLLLLGFVRLLRLTVTATPITDGPWADLAHQLVTQASIRRPVRMLQTRHPALVATWGFFRPVVLVPPSAGEWSPDRARVVIAHEMAHIRRGDWTVQVMAEILRAVYWFNPLVWYACSRLRHESERASDDAVLGMGIGSVSYAEHLVALAESLRTGERWRPPVPAPAILHRSTLERRVAAMLNTTLNRTPVRRSTALTIAATVAGLTLALAGFTASAQGFGTLSGTIADQLNRGVADVPLLLNDPVKQTKHEVKSDALGRFEFLGITAGDYELVVQVPGFRTMRQAVRIDGQEVRRNVTLQLGGIEETVTVVPSDAPPDIPPPVGAVARLRYNPAADRCTAMTSGGCIRPPFTLRHVRPFYPSNLSVDGVIRLNGQIGTDGLVSDLRVQPPAHPELANLAIQAVAQWEYAPTRLDTVPVPTDLEVTVWFTKATGR